MKESDSVENRGLGADQTRLALLDAAKHFFAHNGYEGTTVNQIVSRAGVNASLISYHFGGKEGIYRACLEKMGEAKLGTARRILNPPESVDELRVRLSLFIDEVLNWYVEEPELTLIMLRECEVGSSAMVPVFEKTFLQVFRALETFLNRARALRIIRRELDIPVTCSVILGSISHFARVNTIHKRLFDQSIHEAKYRSRIHQTICNVVMEGLLG